MDNIIDEVAARRATENYSLFGYEPGSATAEYQSICRDADARAAQYPDNPRAQEAAERYKREMAAWINAHNRRGAGHVSWAIAGPSNYNMRKHEKWLAAEGKGWKEYEAIKARFESAMHGAAAPVIHTADPDALEALKEKLEKALAEHAAYLEHNKRARAEGGETLAPYVLKNSNGRIKAIRDRIAQVERLQSREPRRLDFDGGHIEEATEDGRTRIYFDEKPGADLRDRLKGNGWRWSPNAGAWQRQLTANAWYDAKLIVGIK